MTKNFKMKICDGSSVNAMMVKAGAMEARHITNSVCVCE